MCIRHILTCFLLLSVISCGSPEPEEKEVKFDSTKELTDHTRVESNDTITGSMGAENKPEEPDSNFIKRKKDSGIDFFATGTEPFWSVDLDFEKQFSFKTMDGFTLNTPSTTELKKSNPKLKRYRAAVDSGEIIITILEKECTNAMSGATSPYEVTVRVKSSADKDFKDYKGCGRYTSTTGTLVKATK